jgi:hypothetical protein
LLELLLALSPLLSLDVSVVARADDDYEDKEYNERIAARIIIVNIDFDISSVLSSMYCYIFYCLFLFSAAAALFLVAVITLAIQMSFRLFISRWNSSMQLFVNLYPGYL